MLQISVEKIAGRSLFLLFTAIPLMAGLIYALLYSFGLTGILAEGFTLEHWVGILTDHRFYLSLSFSLYIAVVSVFISSLFSLNLTLKYRQMWNSKNWEWGLYIPLAYPAIVAAFIGFQLMSSSGFLSRIAFQLGLIDQPQEFPGLIQDPWGIGIITMHTLMAIPFLTLFWLSIFKKDDLEKYGQLSRTLGATTRQIRNRVFIPVLLKRGKALLILYSIFIAGAYEAPLLMGTQRPQMITIYITNKINRFDLGDRPQAYVALLIVIMIISIILLSTVGRSGKTRQLW